MHARWVAANYEVQTIGTCNGQLGLEFVDSKEECATAAVALVLEDTNVLGGVSLDKPYGCYWKASNSLGGRLWFNPNGNKNGDDLGRVSICRRPGQASDTSGSMIAIFCATRPETLLLHSFEFVKMF